jgi:hypothetical protein
MKVYFRRKTEMKAILTALRCFILFHFYRQWCMLTHVTVKQVGVSVIDTWLLWREKRVHVWRHAFAICRKLDWKFGVFMTLNNRYEVQTAAMFKQQCKCIKYSHVCYKIVMGLDRGSNPGRNRYFPLRHHVHNCSGANPTLPTQSCRK